MLVKAAALLCAFFGTVAPARGNSDVPGPAVSTRPIHGVHLTAWIAGGRSSRRRFLKKLEGTTINAVVVPVKETDGHVYLPGASQAAELGAVQAAIRRPKEMLADMRERGLYTIARIVAFKDNVVPYKKPEWAVQDSSGGIWLNRGDRAWTDPYHPEVWDYVIGIAVHAAELGFDEIQFDYLRYPTEGDTSRCRYYEVEHSSRTAVKNLLDFLTLARERLKPTGARISAALFGLTTSVPGDMGIGQDLSKKAEIMDFVSPMMYPSHYPRGFYGLEDPNREPYRVIWFGLRDARRKLNGNTAKLRPYLQDFSLGFRYGPQQVREQITAAREQGVHSWILWNPQNRYSWEALRPSPSDLGKVHAPVLFEVEESVRPEVPRASVVPPSPPEP